MSDFFSVPTIVTPEISRRGFQKRSIIQNAQERILPTDRINYEYNLREAPTLCDNLQADFGYWLGIGTLIVDMPEDKLVWKGVSSNKIEVRSTGKCEFVLNPGKVIRKELTLFSRGYKKQANTFVNLAPKRFGISDFTYLTLTRNDIGSNDNKPAVFLNLSIDSI
jgi:hypothetical protein